jgi:hypothetical protein
VRRAKVQAQQAERSRRPVRRVQVLARFDINKASSQLPERVVHVVVQVV